MEKSALALALCLLGLSIAGCPPPQDNKVYAGCKLDPTRDQAAWFVTSVTDADNVAVRRAEAQDATDIANAGHVELIGLETSGLAADVRAEAIEWLTETLGDHKLRLESDPNVDDERHANRVLWRRYLWLGDSLINAELIRRGYAAYKPISHGTLVHDALLRQASEEARAALVASGRQPAGQATKLADCTTARGGATLGAKTLIALGQPATGSEYWVSDGTPGGTTLVKDIRPGTGGSDPGLDVAFEAAGSVYFEASIGGSGSTVWITDGTADGTRLVKEWPSEAELGSGSYIRRLFVLGEAAVFHRMTYNPDSSQLWRTDGTTEGTRVLHALDAPVLGDSGDIVEGVTWRGHLYFELISQKAGVTIWRTDGTTEGTTRLTEPAAVNRPEGQRLCVFKDELFAFDTVPDAGTRLVRLDAEGEAQLVKIVSTSTRGDPPRWLVNAGELLYFVVGQRLWQSDGSADGTHLVKGAEGLLVGFDSSLLALGDQVLFSAYSEKTGTEPWIADKDGARLLADLARGSQSSSPKGWIAAGKLAWFFADDGILGREPWATDGTDAGTRPVGDLLPGDPVLGGDFYPHLFRGASDTVYCFTNYAAESSKSALYRLSR